MNYSLSRVLARRVRRVVVLAGLAVSLTGPLRAAEWQPPTPEELALTDSAIEPGAGVEILAADYRINDSDASGARIDHYIRLKVLTKAGAAKLAKIEVAYDRAHDSVTGIEARTIRPDGSVVQLARQDVFEREVVKTGDLRVRLKSFAPPGIEPGALLEYRYRYFRGRRGGMFPLTFQTEYPARAVRFQFRPIQHAPGVDLRALFLNVPPMPLKPNRDGYYEFAQTNIRSRKTEPFQPPEIHTAPSVLLYYSVDNAKNADEYWKDISEWLHEQTRLTTKPTKALQAEVARLLQPGDSDAEKLRKLHDFCRSAIVNLDRALGPKPAKPPTNDDASDTLKHRVGTSVDVNRLFVGLARAAGFDARLALGNDRSDFVAQPENPVPFAFKHWLAAVRRGEKWVLFDPGATYLPAEVVNWRHGDTRALVANQKAKLLVPTESAAAEASQRRRRATLTVDAEGTLEGDVEFEYSGYRELAGKYELDGATPDEVEKHLLAELEPHLKGVELTDIHVDHARDPLVPLKVRFHLRAPEFAERSGARIFVQPSIFRRNGKPPFEEAKRENMIIFPHRYSEADEVTLTVPPGMTLEAGSAPADLPLGKVGRYDVSLTWAPKSRTLRLKREFQLNVIGFPRDSYAVVKGLFEIIQDRDNHTLTFRAGEADALAAKQD
jgi:hypothetical protein